MKIRAYTGRGIRARRSGSERVRMSWTPRAGETPRVWRRWWKTWGVFSAGGERF